MSEEQMDYEKNRSNPEQSEDQGSSHGTAAERIVDAAREQATQAADAFRRGEFMRDPIIDQEASSDDRLIALLSYITQILIPVVMPVIVLLSESSKRRSFQRYHAVQSLSLCVLVIALGAAMIFGTMFMAILPVIGWIFRLLAVLLMCLAPIAVIMVWMAFGFYGYQAYQGKRFAIPGLTSFLRDQGWLE